MTRMDADMTVTGDLVNVGELAAGATEIGDEVLAAGQVEADGMVTELLATHALMEVSGDLNSGDISGWGTVHAAGNSNFASLAGPAARLVVSGDAELGTLTVEAGDHGGGNVDDAGLVEAGDISAARAEVVQITASDLRVRGAASADFAEFGDLDASGSLQAGGMDMAGMLFTEACVTCE